MIDPECATPWGVAKVAGMQLYGWQRKVMVDLLEPGARVTLRAANESGKTTNIAAPTVMWHQLVHARGLCVMTSGAWRQVEDQLMPALQRHGHLFGGWEFTKNGFTTKEGARCIAFSTNDPGKFEGWHGDGDDAPLLMIVDEAKTVDDSIFAAIERCRPDRLLLMSSPGASTGYFYESFNKRAKWFKQHAVTAHDCPHISKDKIDRQIAEWGLDHPLTRSMIFGEFMASGGDEYVIDFTALEKAQRNPPPHMKAREPLCFCDFAAGGDENVLVMRQGNKVESVDMVCWRDRDTMAGVGRFIVEFRKRGLAAESIWVDEGGVGRAMADALREAGWDVNRCNNGSKAQNESAYTNRGAEMWHEFAKMVSRGEVIIPDDKALVQQLTTRRRRIDSKGRLGLESKEDMRARGLGSPDRADAIVGAFANTPVLVWNTGVDHRAFDDVFSHSDEHERGPVPGAWAGL